MTSPPRLKFGVLKTTSQGAELSLANPPNPPPPVLSGAAFLLQQWRLSGFSVCLFGAGSEAKCPGDRGMTSALCPLL